jgi:hypothetical protein
MNMTLSTEGELLLSVLKNEEERLRVLARKGDIAWGKVISKAIQHGVSPLLYVNLRKASLDSIVPEQMMDWLRRAYLDSVARSLLNQQEIECLLKTFSRKSIPVIVLKGGVLAQTLYANPALRPMGDVDLLIRQADIVRVKPLLLTVGYQISPDPFCRSASFRWRFLKGMPFRKVGEDGASLELDLHWHLVFFDWYGDVVKMDLDGFWQRAVPVNIAGKRVLQLCPEDTILHLCAHMAINHKYQGLLRYVDLARALRVYKLNWEHVVERAIQFRIKIATYFALRFCDELLGTSVPVEVMRDLCPPCYRMAVIERIVSLERVVDPVKPFFVGKEERFWHMVLLDRPSDLISMIKFTFFPDVDWLKTRYSVRTALEIWFRYPFHILRMIGYSLIALGRLLFGSRLVSNAVSLFTGSQRS